jgi:hypothetical protein
MTKQRISNKNDLKNEIRRLRALSQSQEKQLLEAINQMTESLKPENLLLKSFSSLTGININKDEFLKNGFKVGISLILQRYLLKKEILFERKLYDWMDSIFNRVRSYTSKFSNVRAERMEKAD